MASHSGPPVVPPTAATFDIVANNLLSDPLRPRVYAALSSSNAIAVINTQSLTIEKTIAVGLQPRGLAMSADGATLYVANTGERSISVVNLGTLAAVGRLPVVYNPFDVAAGLGNRLYVTPAVDHTYAIQVDAKTGASQPSPELQKSGVATRGRVQTSPDRQTLYIATENFPRNDRYDVSTASAVMTYKEGAVGELSHDGRFLVSPNRQSSTDALGSVAGTYSVDEYWLGLGPGALSPDDTRFFVYDKNWSGFLEARVVVFSNKTFRHLGSFPVAVLENDYHDLRHAVVDSTGRYLFMGDATKIVAYDVSPRLTGDDTVSGYSDEPFSYRTMLNFDAERFSASGLPSGWSMDTTTGVVSTRSVKTGDYTFTLSAHIGPAVFSKAVTFQIRPRPPMPWRYPVVRPISPVAEFALKANKLVEDPTRRRIYATIPSTNTVVVLRTDTLALEKSVFIGSDPTHMSISPDGKKLFVVNRGGTAIGVLDLNTLLPLPPLDIGRCPRDVEAGLNNRLYVTVVRDSYDTADENHGLLQVDATSAAIQAQWDPYSPGGLVEISPDWQTLYYTGDDGAQKLDVSGATPKLLQTGPVPSYDFNLSHNGRFFFYNGFKTLTADLKVRIGSSAKLDPPGPTAFSLDDTVVFQGEGIEPGRSRLPDLGIAVFSSTTRKRIDTLRVSAAAFDHKIHDIITDGTGNFLVTSDQDAIRIYDNKPRLEPADVSTLVCTVGDPCSFTIQRNFEPTSFTAQGLPPGLEIDSVSGTITGMPTQSGRFTATVVGTRGLINASQSYSFAVYPPTRLLNISTRGWVPPNQAIIAGFIVSGLPTKKLALRGIGPSINAGGGPQLPTLQDPTLALCDILGRPVAGSYDDLSDDPASKAELEKYGLVPSDPREAAAVTTVSSGPYTLQVSDRFSAGHALAEVYDLSPSGSRILNVSTRAYISTRLPMIGGFILGGSGSTRIFLRALGPSLDNDGVLAPVEDPRVELINSEGTVVYANNNWKDVQRAEIEATSIPPRDDREAAIVLDLGPGAYTAVVKAMRLGGESLVEVYNLLP